MRLSCGASSDLRKNQSTGFHGDIAKENALTLLDIFSQSGEEAERGKASLHLNLSAGQYRQRVFHKSTGFPSHDCPASSVPWPAALRKSARSLFSFLCSFPIQGLI